MIKNRMRTVTLFDAALKERGEGRGISLKILRCACIVRNLDAGER